jgi:hypothetical protein
VGEKVTMNPKTTILAAVVLAALGAYIYFYEREPIEPDTDSEGQEVFDIDADALHQIEIRNADGEAVDLEKDGEDWKIVAPVEAPADASEVDTLARNIANLECQRFITQGEEVSLADFGLDRPEVEVSFRTEDAEEPNGFMLGDETPTGSNRYGKLRGDDKVFVVSSYLKSNFDKTAWDLRDKKIMHFDRDDVQKVVLRSRSPEGEIVLARESKDRWNVATPSFCRADRYKASSLVSRFETAKMEEIVSDAAEDLEPYGLDRPSYEVEIQLAGGKSAELRVGDEKEGRYYAVNPGSSLVYLIGSSIVDDIKKDASEFRSKRLFDYATYQVTKFQIAPANEPTRVYEKVEGEGEEEEVKWMELEPESRQWERSKVEDLLYKMNGTDAKDFAADVPDDPSLYGLAQPAFTITVWSKEGENVEELTVGKPEGDWVYARRKGDDPVLKIEVSAWDDIEKLMDFTSEPEESEEPEGEKQ